MNEEARALLRKFADELEASGEFPAQPTPEYPLFPDALREVANVQDEQLLGSNCHVCKTLGYYYPADKAYAPGHCYTEAGQVEYRNISGYCEYCFDKAFAEQEPKDADSEINRMFLASLFIDEVNLQRFQDLLDDQVPDEHSEDL